jgi:hypothetical protein
MSEFMKALVETVDRFQGHLELEADSRHLREREDVCKALFPVIDDLEKLMSLEARFYDGSPFEYTVFPESPTRSAIEILTQYPCYVFYNQSDDHPFWGFCSWWGEPFPQEFSGPKYRTKFYDSREELSTELALYLGAYIGNLGLLDKSIYGQESQDIIGIE